MGNFEGTQVQLTNCLFRCPNTHTVTVVFLIVQRAVLIVDMNALFLNAGAFRGTDHTGKGSALAKILAATSGIRGAMQVQTDAVQTGTAGPQTILANHIADFLLPTAY